MEGPLIHCTCCQRDLSPQFIDQRTGLYGGGICSFGAICHACWQFTEIAHAEKLKSNSKIGVGDVLMELKNTPGFYTRPYN